MRTLLVAGVVLATVGAIPSRAVARRCGDAPADASAVAAVRTQVASHCHCAKSATHGRYVRCAARVAARAVHDGLLRMECKGRIVKCAAKSTCGRPDEVTCEMPTTTSSTTTTLPTEPCGDGTCDPDE